MRAIRFHHFGPPAEALQLDDLPEEMPGPGQVRLRLTHRPINPSDLLTISGHYGRLPRLPAVAGLEGVGRVAALGEGVTGWRVGDRAIPLGAGGTWRESVTVAAAQLLPVPDAVSDETAAQFVVNPVTAWVMLEEELALRPGDWLAQTAAGSALGRLVIQLAQLRGYHTVNFVRRPEQVAELLALGADAVFCTDEADVAGRVRALTDGRGVAGALDAVGGETGALALRCLRPGDWLAQTAAGSALGRLVIQLAQLRGYHTVNFVRRADAVAELRDLGADAVFSTDEAPNAADLVARVRALTDGRGVAGALDAVGGETGALALHCLRPGGTLLVYGLLGGEPLPLHNGEMLFRGLTVRGFWLTHWFQHTPPERAQTTLRELMGLMAGGQLTPTAEAAYDLADFRAAVAHAQRPGRQGKIMLIG